MNKKYEPLNLHCTLGPVFFISLSITSSDHSFSLPGSHGNKNRSKKLQKLNLPIIHRSIHIVQNW